MDGALVSSPTARDDALYVGTTGGSIVAIEQANPQVPRLAVFYDSTPERQAYGPGARMAREYFQTRGYELLSAESLARFMAARVADSLPSAIVFAIDVLPASVAPDDSDTALVRRYLNAGGKIVWAGPPPALRHDAQGNITAFQRARMDSLLGVPATALRGDRDVVRPDASGLAWGIDRWFPGIYPIAAGGMTQPLALDAEGLTSAWVRVYRPDRPGSGFVQLWGMGASYERLPAMRAVAEYGLLRRAHAPGPG